MLDSALLYLTSQEDFNTSDFESQRQISLFFIESPSFLSNSNLFLSYLKDRSCHVGPENNLYCCLWLYYQILICYQTKFNSSLNLNLSERKFLFQKLINEIQEPIDGRLELPALLLLNELLKQSLSLAESSILCDLLPFLFKLTECARENNELISYAVNYLLVFYHHQSLQACPQQFDLDPSSIKERYRKRFTSLGESPDPFCDSQAVPDFEGIIQYSPVLSYLSDHFYTAKHFGEDLIFMINREDNLYNLVLVMDFLTDLFHYPPTSEYLYTNDLFVLVDIIIRQLCNMDDYLYELRYAFLGVLSSLMNFSQYRTTRHKFDEIISLLKYMSTQSDHSEPTSTLISEKASHLLAFWDN